MIKKKRERKPNKNKLVETQQTASFEDDIIRETDRESDHAKVVETLLNDKYRRRKTILKNRQVVPLTFMDVISQVYEVIILQQWVVYFGEYRTSGDGGKGRKDIVDISKFAYASKTQENMKMIEEAMKGR